MNTNNSHNYNSETPKTSKTIAFKQLFVKGEVAEILMDKTRIANKRPEDIVSAKNKQNAEVTVLLTHKLFRENKNYFEWKLWQEDFSLFYNLLKRRYKKLKQEDIVKTMKFLLDKWIEGNLLIELAKIVKKTQNFSEILHWWLGVVFDYITNIYTSKEESDSLLLEYLFLLKNNNHKTEEQTFNDRFFYEIHISPSFEPEEELKKILSLKSEEKQKALNIFYKNLKKQLDIISSLPGKIKNLDIKFDNEKVSHWEYTKLVIQYLENDFRILSTKQRIAVIKQISKLIKLQKNISEKSFWFTPSEFLSHILNIPIEKFKWWISYEKSLTCAIFYIENKEDFAYIYELLGSNDSNNILWFFSESFSLPISIINWNKSSDLLTEAVNIHEVQHSENRLTISDFSTNDILISAKDEIIAYFKDWYNNIWEIETALLKRYNDGWIYDYYSKELEKKERYQELRKYYEKDLEKALNIAKYMKELDIPNYLEILAIIPVRKWDLLKKIYKKEQNQDTERLRNNMIKIFGELSKIY